VTIDTVLPAILEKTLIKNNSNYLRIPIAKIKPLHNIYMFINKSNIGKQKLPVLYILVYKT